MHLKQSSRSGFAKTFGVLVALGIVSAAGGCGVVDRQDVVDLIKKHDDKPTPPPPLDPCATVRCKAGYQCVVNKTNPPQAACVPVDEPAPNPCAVTLCPPNQVCVTSESYPPQAKCVAPPDEPKRCVATTDCAPGLRCSTERGECLGCGGPKGTVCPAVCFGICEKPEPAGECQTDADCKLVDNYCDGCGCLAVSSTDKVPVCSDPVACIVAPCQGKAAVCAKGQCMVQEFSPPPPRKCITEVQGGETSCKPASVWKQYAFESCQAKGLTLTALSPGTPCGGDSSRYIKYECCSN
ncbi:MAG: hypothetical protein SF187_22345 [Deltaproteobacteria bacterium]|nr:hypothetical protein [Deltaproteobacteria bacterium]